MNGNFVPDLLELGDDRQALVKIAARHILLPDPDVVAAVGGPVFPTIRDQKNRVTLSEIEGRKIMLDDNATPRWALLWSHGIAATHHLPGWTFAHVWGLPKDLDAYSRLANLCMMPEYLGSLSDKAGPLCAFLQYHAFACYGWHPASRAVPSKPPGYDAVEWRYLPPIANPLAYVHKRLSELNNQRVHYLRPLMGLSGAPT
jgi:hypothetical protein